MDAWERPHQFKSSSGFLHSHSSALGVGFGDNVQQHHQHHQHQLHHRRGDHDSSSVVSINLLVGIIEGARGVEQRQKMQLKLNALGAGLVVLKLIGRATTLSKEVLLAALPEDHQLVVLEVGAGTGSTASSVLPLLKGRCRRYIFTDVSEVFLNQAQRRFAESIQEAVALKGELDTVRKGDAREKRRREGQHRNARGAEARSLIASQAQKLRRGGRPAARSSSSRK